MVEAVTTMNGECPVCGGMERKHLAERRDGHDVVLCLGCGAGYLRRMPSVDEIASYYDSAYFDGRRDDLGTYEGLVSHFMSERLRVRYSQHPSSYHLNWIGRHGIHLAGCDVLDIGTGAGALLVLLSQHGARPEGIDVSPVAARYAHDWAGCGVHAGALPHAGLEGKTFDLITAIDLIEHVSDPGSLLRHARTLLRPGGHLLLVTPNLNLGIRHGSRWYGFTSHFDHVVYYTPQALEELAARTGLAPRATSTVSVGTAIEREVTVDKPERSPADLTRRTTARSLPKRIMRALLRATPIARMAYLAKHFPLRRLPVEDEGMYHHNIVMLAQRVD